MSQYSIVKVKSPVNCQHPEGHPSADGKHKILDWPTHFVESGSHTRTVAEQRTCLSGKVDRRQSKDNGGGEGTMPDWDESAESAKTSDDGPESRVAC